nr:MAG TPA: PGDYG protein [Caudoviricetes sp.]
MVRYKTKPCEIEAIQYTGNNLIEILDWGQGKILWNDVDDLFVDTLEGRMRADVYDYIIKGLRGEYYPCKPDVFEKKYEEIK